MQVDRVRGGGGGRTELEVELPQGIRHLRVADRAFAQRAARLQGWREEVENAADGLYGLGLGNKNIPKTKCENKVKCKTLTCVEPKSMAARMS